MVRSYEEGVIRELSLHAVTEAMGTVRAIAKNAEVTHGLGTEVIDAAMLGIAVLAIDYLDKVGVKVLEIKL